MQDYFILDGVDSRDYGIYLINDGLREINGVPNKNIRKKSIAGKDGYFVFEQNYSAAEKRINCFCDTNDPDILRQINGWLSSLTQVKLILSYEPYKEFTVDFNRQINFRQGMNGNTFTIVFSAQPFAKSRYSSLDIDGGIDYDSDPLVYYDSGLYYNDEEILDYVYTNITSNTNLDIYNGSNVKGSFGTPFKLTINGSASSISIKHYSDAGRTDLINEYEYGSFNGELIIDMNISNTFLDGNVDNETQSGDYFGLLPDGFNYLRIEGTSLNLTNVEFDFNFLYV